MELPWWLPFGKVPEVSAAQFDVMRKEGPALPQRVAVRSPKEWQSGHIDGALDVPITELGSRIAGLKLDPSRPVGPDCRTAARSIPAVRLSQQHGVDTACQQQGGMFAWGKAGPAVVGDGSATPPAGRSMQ